MARRLEPASFQTNAPKVGEYLPEKGLITGEQLRKALMLQGSRARRLGRPC
ncbi:MAG: hypothetical protein GXP47_12440 [Acidobacteria bacterium]|nr:hypothetical protein [Acidobacteriota bacterium]